MPTNKTGPYNDNNYRVDDNIGRLIVAAASSVIAETDRSAKSMGISWAQWVVLIRIIARDDTTASDLCRTIGYDSGSMTRMLDRLEHQGLLVRKKDDNDRRVTRIVATQAARDLQPKLQPMAIAVLNKYLRGFSFDEVSVLADMLRRMIANGEAS